MNLSSGQPSSMPSRTAVHRPGTVPVATTLVLFGIVLALIAFIVWT